VIALVVIEQVSLLEFAQVLVLLPVNALPVNALAVFA
jgi:hypothetical protein